MIDKDTRDIASQAVRTSPRVGRIPKLLAIRKDGKIRPLDAEGILVDFGDGRDLFIHCRERSKNRGIMITSICTDKKGGLLVMRGGGANLVEIGIEPTRSGK